jgi:hypothetical protein
MKNLLRFSFLFILYLINFVENSNNVKERLSVERNNLIVEYLIVIDSTVYNHFIEIYGKNVSQSAMSSYINQFYQQMVNSVS